MRRALAMLALLAAIGCASLASSPSTSPATGPLHESRQLIVVTSDSWDETHATLRRYERATTSEAWQLLGGPIPVMLGRSGLAWGVGINSESGDGPRKHEGDGKSPAGIFRLGAAFGFAATADGVKLPYVPLRPTTECVDDVASMHYNRIVDRAEVPRVDWSSSEKMRAIPVYEWGVVVLHNDAPTAGGGSCIFLHATSGKPTSGCTAMPADDIAAIAHWLDPDARPLLVQLPSAEYARLRGRWQLP